MTTVIFISYLNKNFIDILYVVVFYKLLNICYFYIVNLIC